MKNKKGFTLVELLAVIAILAILVIIALPNVMGMFNNAKKNSFTTELKEIYKVAQQTWMNDSMFETKEQEYVRCKTCTGKSLPLNGRQEIDYYVKLNKAGDVVEYYATDGTYQYSYKGNGLIITDITNVVPIADLNDSEKIAISDSGASEGTSSSSIGGTLMAGISSEPYENYLRTNIVKDKIEIITFTNSLSGHTANGTNCWDLSVDEDGTVLAWISDNDSNGMYEMTIGSNGMISISTGKNLFYEMNGLTAIYGIQYLDTSNVTTMESMFIYCSSLRTIDLTNFNTSSVTNMSHMFHGCISMTSIDLSSFNTSNVTNMSYMFYQDASLTSIILNNVDTTKVTNMKYMFKECSQLTSLNLSNFNTSNVTDMSYMFDKCSNLRTIITKSSFITSSVTNSSRMFNECNSLVGGNGTAYSSSHIDKSYAHEDGGTSNPGYFTSG